MYYDRILVFVVCEAMLCSPVADLLGTFEAQVLSYDSHRAY